MIGGPIYSTTGSQFTLDELRGMAERLGLGPSLHEPLSQLFARWDGKGQPPIRGEAIDSLIYLLPGLSKGTSLARQPSGEPYPSV